MKTFLRRTVVTLLLIVAVLGGALLFLSRGQQPLEDRRELASGKVVTVADGYAAAYLVMLDDGGGALVDAGMSSDASAILDAMTERGLAPGDLQAIFLTHGHGDHIGGVLAFPAADVYVLEADADLVEGRRVADNLLGQFREPAPTGISVFRELQDGDRLVVNGTSFEVFAIPGHTRGSAALLVHGVLFLGDSAGARSDGGIAAAPPVFSANREQNRASLLGLAERLRNREDAVAWLAFGHQGALEGLTPLLDWAAAAGAE